jgi:hypothetical protein
MLGAGAAAAGQLGLGYGLGIIAWLPAVSGDQTTAAWTSSLAWTTFIGATSVVIGAVVGDRSGWAGRNGRVQRAAWCVVLALAASLGALATIPLVSVPASQAKVVDTFAPHLLAAIYAAAGVVIGLVVAIAALAARAVAVNVLTMTAWLWILAIVAVAGWIAAGRIDHADLGVWKFTNTGPEIGPFYLPGVLILVGGALLIGGLAAFVRAMRGDGRVGVAISGAAGPIIVTAAYVLANPATDRATFEAVSAARTAPIMIAAGLVGSVLVAAVGGVRRRPKRQAKTAEAAPPAPDRPTTPAPDRPIPARPTASATASVPAAYRLDPSQYPPPRS